jgi:hypothetical protein
MSSGIAKGQQKLVDRARGFSPGFGVGQQADAVGTPDSLDTGLGGHEGLDHFNLSAHRGGEKRWPRAVRNQEFRNGTVAHVR